MNKLVLMLFLSINCQLFAKTIVNNTRRAVVIIDTGYTSRLDSTLPKNAFCKNGIQDVTGSFTEDVIGHGTNVINLVGQGLDYDKYCLVSIKYYNINESGAKLLNNSIKALELSYNFNTVLINISSSGYYFDTREEQVLKNLTKNGVKVVVAAGNDGLDLGFRCMVFPACYNLSFNYYVVGALDNNNMLYSKSNRNGPVKHLEFGVNKCGGGICMTGTSQAAAVKSNTLIKLMK